MIKGSRSKARQAAVQALYQWQMTGQAPADIERNFISDNSLAGMDIEYFRLLVQNVPRHLDEIDGQLAPHVARTIAEVDPVERAILRLGAYEFGFHPEIPYKVILNEAVELAKVFGAEHGHKFINAVLDKVASQLRAAEIRPGAGPGAPQ